MSEVDKEEVLKTKVRNEFPEFIESVDNLPVEKLNENLLRYAVYREETEMAKSTDKGLIKAKNDVKEYQAPYNETLKALKLKMAYLHLLIVEKKGGSDEKAKAE
ncbi:MAG TPA: hypothetical protein DDY18_07410 [Flavobacterium sp.]|jgi:hypothetical protein|nr:hypothetical protein [Flavobacterium sp.]